MDISQYVNKDTIPTWDSVDPALKEVFTDGGKLYAVPTKNYSMGLVYNKTCSSRPGSTRTTRRRPGPRSATAAKKIAALGNGIAGYAEYSAGNTGGWHFTAELYSQGGQVLTDGRQEGRLQQRRGQAGPAEPQGHALRRQQHGRQAAAAVGATC